MEQVAERSNDGSSSDVSAMVTTITEDGGGTNGTPASAPEAFLIMLYLICLASLTLYGLVQLWPGPTPSGGAAPIIQPISYLGWTFQVSDEVRLLLLVALTGGLGGLLHALRSVAWYIGQQELKRNWLPTYLTLPFVGTTLSVIFYLVIRGGFFSPQASFQQTSPFGFAAMAGVIGMFSPQAVLKLKQVAEIVLTRPPEGKNAAPQVDSSTASASRPR
jgi:hypothetical protein